MARRRSPVASLGLALPHRVWRLRLREGVPCRGILQGCPASGSLWALLLDPVARALSHAHLEPQGSLTAFADDLAAAFANVLRGVGPVMEVFMRLPLATGLQLHIPKAKVVNDSGCTFFDLRRRLLDRLGAHTLDVVGSVRYHGVPIGPLSSATYWDRALGNFAHRCAALRASPAHLSAKATRYGMYCLSVVVFLGQLAPPVARLLSTEAAIVSSLCAALMYAITPIGLSATRHLGSSLGFHTVAESCRAASMRLAVWADILDHIQKLLCLAADSDEAFLAPRSLVWLALRATARRLPQDTGGSDPPPLRF